MPIQNNEAAEQSDYCSEVHAYFSTSITVDLRKEVRLRKLLISTLQERTTSFCIDFANTI